MRADQDVGRDGRWTNGDVAACHLGSLRKPASPRRAQLPIDNCVNKTSFTLYNPWFACCNPFQASVNTSFEVANNRCVET